MDNKQSLLLEQYILALRADSSAPIPADLEPDLVQMAQRLVTYSQVTADTSVKKRMWGAVLSEFEATIQTEEQKKYGHFSPNATEKIVYAVTVGRRFGNHLHARKCDCHHRQ